MAAPTTCPSRPSSTSATSTRCGRRRRRCREALCHTGEPMRDEDRLYSSTARLVLTQFGLPADAELTRLTTAHNHVFRVDHDARRYVLRFQPAEPLTDAALGLQLTWLQS